MSQKNALHLQKNLLYQIMKIEGWFSPVFEIACSALFLIIKLRELEYSDGCVNPRRERQKSFDEYPPLT